MMEKANPVRRLPILTAKEMNPVKRSPGLADGKSPLTSKNVHVIDALRQQLPSQRHAGPIQGDLTSPGLKQERLHLLQSSGGGIGHQTCQLDRREPYYYGIIYTYFLKTFLASPLSSTTITFS
jgi:hypothetical protein